MAGILAKSGVVVVDGYGYSYLQVTSASFATGYATYTANIANGDIARNEMGGVLMWRTKTDILDWWVIESDTLDADIIRKLKPHS